MRIQHNIMAMSAYRNYTNNVSAMKKNLEKLSSGYKINRAGDDAAGLAISEKMRAQITGLQTAQKNAKDGISLVQTAEGALTEVHDMLNRMVELATMSANGTYDDTVDRYQLQKEMNQLRDEIDRIADSANFNGIKLLNGEMDGGGAKAASVKFELSNMSSVTVTNIKDGQIPTKDPQKGKYSVDFSNATISNNSTANGAIHFELTSTISVNVTLNAGASLSGASIADAIKTQLLQTATAQANGYTSGATGLLIDGITFNVTVDGDKLVFEMKEDPTKDFNTTTFTATVAPSFNGAAMTFGQASSVNSSQGEQFQVTQEREAVSKVGRVYGQSTYTLTTANVTDGAAIQIGNEAYVFAVGKDSEWKGNAAAGNVIDLTDMEEGTVDVKVVAARLSEAAKDNKSFKVGANIGGSGQLSFTEKEGGVDYSKNNLAGLDNKAVANGATSSGANVLATAADWAGLIQMGSANMTAIAAVSAPGKSLTLQIGDTADEFNKLSVDIPDMHVSSLKISESDISIANQDDAAAAITKIKDAINAVSNVRGTLGAIQNRLDHTINNLSVMTENIQDAESTIRDVDVAEEMMAYTKNNILIQSAQAMLAQANQVPQGVLQLLQ